MTQQQLEILDDIRARLADMLTPRRPHWMDEEYTPKHRTFDEAMDAAENPHEKTLKENE